MAKKKQVKHKERKKFTATETFHNYLRESLSLGTLTEREAINALTTPAMLDAFTVPNIHYIRPLGEDA
jgi:hypothetical protein